MEAVCQEGPSQDHSEPNSPGAPGGERRRPPSCGPSSILKLSLLFLVATTEHWRLQDPLSHFTKEKKHMRNIHLFLPQLDAVRPPK